jgi:UDP-glucuronate 4-epimerase
VKILVTGAGGFIGFHVSQGLLALGDEVIGLENLSDYYDPSIKVSRVDILRGHRNLRFVKLDLVDRGGIEALFKAENFGRVIHRATRHSGVHADVWQI